LGNSGEKKEEHVDEETAKAILSTVFERIDERLTCEEIIERAHKNISRSERQVIRCLNWLVEKGMLHKDSEGKNRFYTPDYEAYAKLVYISQPQRASIGELDKFQIMAPIIYSKFKKATGVDFESKDDQAGKSKVPCVGGGVSRDNLKKLTTLTCDLLDTLKSALDIKYLGGGTDPSVLYGFLWDNVTNVVSAYMDAWQFIYSTPGAAAKFGEQMEYSKTKLREKLARDIIRMGK
jgi:hypothetical protein